MSYIQAKERLLVALWIFVSADICLLSLILSQFAECIRSKWKVQSTHAANRKHLRRLHPIRHKTQIISGNVGKNYL